jgi:hypothetical protein
MRGGTEVPNTEGDTTRTARRPRVICHMMTSVDGRIVVEGWPLAREGSRQYEEVHATYAPDAWLCGRVTMAQHFACGHPVRGGGDAHVRGAPRARTSSRRAP